MWAQWQPANHSAGEKLATLKFRTRVLTKAEEWIGWEEDSPRTHQGCILSRKCTCSCRRCWNSARSCTSCSARCTRWCPPGWRCAGSAGNRHRPDRPDRIRAFPAPGTSRNPAPTPCRRNSSKLTSGLPPRAGCRRPCGRFWWRWSRSSRIRFSCRHNRCLIQNNYFPPGHNWNSRVSLPLCFNLAIANTNTL